MSFNCTLRAKTQMAIKDFKIFFAVIFGSVGLMTPASAQMRNYNTGGYYHTGCMVEIPTERYSPGFYDPYGNWVPGRVSYGVERVPCQPQQYVPQQIPQNPPYIQQQRKCNSLTSGAYGAAIAGALSKNEALRWSLPLGFALGSSVCN